MSDFKGEFEVLVPFTLEGRRVQRGQVIEVHDFDMAADLATSKLVRAIGETGQKLRERGLPVRTTAATVTTFHRGRP